LKVEILAADSMGVRSLATFVEACGVAIGVDLGASLAPRRYGLPPHDVELKALEESLDRIRRRLSEAHIVIITHYHYDHYIAEEPELYYGKILLVKHPRQDINVSQRLRAHRFLVKSGLLERSDVRYADGMQFDIDGVRIRFSPPVWHGEPGTKVGRVIMAAIECDDGLFVFGSDTQGPIDEEALSWLTSLPQPDVLVIDGPPTYFAGYKVSVDAVRRGIENLKALLRSLRPRAAVVDHHLARDRRVEEILGEVSRAAGLEARLAARYMGREPRLLEAMRRDLWRGSTE
jgi:predicted metallo-beta-lactamase superfamily hydrolase